MIKMNFEKKYYPSKDEVFSIMFEKHELFERLLNAVLREDGQKPVTVHKPKCQYTLTGENARKNMIRFDVFARDKQDNIYSIDMQGNYRVKRVRNRIVYYVCKALSNEEVVDSRYEDLKNVYVTFIMSKYDKAPNAVERYQLLSSRTKEPYTDLLTLYEVYAPRAETLPDSSELKIFLRFFTIFSEEDAEKFRDDFNGIELAKILIESYNAALTSKDDIDRITRKSVYKSKNTDELILALQDEADKRVEEATERVTKETTERVTQEVTQQVNMKFAKTLRELGQSDQVIAKSLGIELKDVPDLFESKE